MHPGDEDNPGYASPPCFMHELDPAFSGGQTGAGRRRCRALAQSPENKAAGGAPCPPGQCPGAGCAEDRQPARCGDRNRRGQRRGHLLAVPWRAGPSRMGVNRDRTRGTACSSCRSGEGEAAGVPDLVTRREAGEGRLEHPGAGWRQGDPSGHRCGSGGGLRRGRVQARLWRGFYDRTLAAMPSRPLTFGVGYALAKLPTIYPQWHDIPLDRMIIDGA